MTSLPTIVRLPVCAACKNNMIIERGDRFWDFLVGVSWAELEVLQTVDSLCVCVCVGVTSLPNTEPITVPRDRLRRPAYPCARPHTRPKKKKKNTLTFCMFEWMQTLDVKILQRHKHIHSA